MERARHTRFSLPLLPSRPGGVQDALLTGPQTHIAVVTGDVPQEKGSVQNWPTGGYWRRKKRWGSSPRSGRIRPERRNSRRWPVWLI